MSNLERDLRDMLARRADAAPMGPGDWQDLTVRMSRRNKRSRRLLAAGLVTALLVGPLAGFAVARAVEDGEPAGRVTAAGPGAAGNGDAVGTTEGRVATAGAASGLQIFMPGGRLDKLFRRTTGDGVVIRAYLSQIGGNSCQGDGWCPPADCFADATVAGELSTDAAVGYAYGSHFGGDAPDLRLTGGGTFGASGEGTPVRYVVAQSGRDVAKVRVSFEGGGSDEMAPVNGVVVLAAPADPSKSGGTVEALDGGGNVIGHAAVTDAATATLGIAPSAAVPGQIQIQSTGSIATGSGTASTTVTTTPPSGVASAAASPPVAPPTSPDGGSLPSRCTPPPPSLPAPGEQPANVDAARAEIEHAFATAYNGGLGSDEEKRAVVQDSDALKPVMEQIRNGSFAQQVKDATAKVTDVVFTSPTEAAVRYDIDVANYSNFTDRIGKALLIDGHWKVARVTVCADISLAGGNCPPA